MSAFDDRPTTVALPATTGKPWGGRGDTRHAVTALGVTGHGATLATARADYLTNLTNLVTLAQSAPRVGIDDDDSVIVTYPRGTGWETVRVAPDRSWSTSMGDRPGIGAWHIVEVDSRGRDIVDED
jgi:hypothetical protein